MTVEGRVTVGSRVTAGGHRYFVSEQGFERSRVSHRDLKQLSDSCLSLDSVDLARLERTLSEEGEVRCCVREAEAPTPVREEAAGSRGP